MKQELYNEEMTREEFMETVEGKTIIDCAFNEDDSGMHFQLDDGRFVILTGEYMIWVGRLDKSRLQ